MKPGSKQKAGVRQHLLDAAYHLFTTQGVGRVGIDLIVATCGCAKASLYNNFKSKEHLARIRAMVRGFAKEARLANGGAFAQAWHMLMKGSIVAAGEGNRRAALEAQRAARLMLEGWARRP